MTNQEWYNMRNNPELRHSAGQRKNHKYIARIADSTGKKFRYFYDQAELAAYNNAKKVGKYIDNNITGSSYKKAANESNAKAYQYYRNNQNVQARSNAQNLKLTENYVYGQYKDYDEAYKAEKKMVTQQNKVSDHAKKYQNDTNIKIMKQNTITDKYAKKYGKTVAGRLSRGMAKVSSILGKRRRTSHSTTGIRGTSTYNI